jgi:signal transduction histidine kinase
MLAESRVGRRRDRETPSRDRCPGTAGSRTVSVVTSRRSSARRLLGELVVRPQRLVRPPLLDLAIAAVFVGLTLAEVATTATGDQTWRLLVFAAPAMASLAVRRQYPLLVALVVTNVNWVANPDNEFTTLLSLVLVAFTAGYETGPPRSYLGLALVLVPFLGNILSQGHLVPSDVAAAIVFLVGPWAVGQQSRQRAIRAEAAETRAAQLEREQDLRAQLVAAAERTRIARELHDIVSHSISVVTIQTQAVRRRLGPDHAAEAADLAQVEATARQALGELRRLFGVLRQEGDQVALEPQPGLDNLDRLVEQARAGGLDVRLDVQGTAQPLPPGIDLAAYRIAQEGLTNALRHSGASTVTIGVRHLPDAVEVEVRDNGRGLVRNGSPGHGLVGIRERVALYDGTVDLGDAPGGGVRLAAHLPTGRPT